MLFTRCIINFLPCVRNVIKMKYTVSALFFAHCQIQGPIMPRLLFSTQESIVVKHNAVVFWGMKASHCYIPVLGSKFLFDING